MITRAIHDMHAACIALFLMLVPGIALSQDQKEPVVAQPQKASEASAPLNSGASTTTLPGSQEPAAAATAAEPVAVKTAPGQEGTAPYIIKKGDTLWDLSNTFMKDPFLWPFIWKANPAITNPDLIYPGNSLTTPNLAPIERALKAPAGQEQVTEEARPEKAAAATEQIQGKTAVTEAAVPPSTIIAPEEKPIPLIDRYSMLKAGFVDENSDSDSIVLGGPEKGKTIFGSGEFVYVKISGQENVNIGDKFLIYTRLKKVTHPRTNNYYGRLIRGLGILQITAKDSPTVLTARITLSFDAIEKGNLLTPYQEPAFIYNTPEKRSKDISGSIIELTDRRTISGQTDYVYLDRGSADGVEAGDRFTVYEEHDEPGFPRKKIGEVQVFLVKERTSTAVVRKSTESMTTGDVIDFKK